MKLFKSVLICSLLTFSISAWAAPYDEEDKAESIKKLEQKKEHAQKAEKLATLTDRPADAIHANNFQIIYELMAKCIATAKNYQEDDICYIEGLQALAKEDNPAAMHLLGNMMEAYGNPKKAIEWYEKALKSENLPDWYREEVENDIKRAKEKI